MPQGSPCDAPVLNEKPDVAIVHSTILINVSDGIFGVKRLDQQEKISFVDGVIAVEIACESVDHQFQSVCHYGRAQGACLVGKRHGVSSAGKRIETEKVPLTGIGILSNEYRGVALRMRNSQLGVRHATVDRWMPFIE